MSVENGLIDDFKGDYADDADMVNHPPHYNKHGIECFDAIRAALDDDEFRGYIKGNLIKYTWRERYKNGDFKIPIHLALGHETIAVSVDAVMQEQDALFLTHRNVHYNLIS